MFGAAVRHGRRHAASHAAGGRARFRAAGRQGGGSAGAGTPFANVGRGMSPIASPRVTRRHIGPESPNPASRLHGMSAAEAEARAQASTLPLNSAHLTHTAAEKMVAQAAGQRLQPKSNPHIQPLLEQYLAKPRPEAYKKLLSELIRGPVYVFVSETEMALKESEIQMAAMKHRDAGVALPKNLSFAPLMFYERDADHKEDGDALMVKRELGTLAPEYSYKRGSSFTTIYTDVARLEEAMKHPGLKLAGIERVTYIGLRMDSIVAWASKEMAQPGGMGVYLNRWTESEVLLNEQDIRDIEALVHSMQGTAPLELEDFTPMLGEDATAATATETWNEFQDKRTMYIDSRRALLKQRRAKALGAGSTAADETAKEREAREAELAALAGAVTGDAVSGGRGGTAVAAATPALTSTATAAASTPNGDWAPVCDPHLRMLLVAVCLQRPELQQAAVLTHGATGRVALAIRSSDFAATAARIRTVSEFFAQDADAASEGAPTLPHIDVLDMAAEAPASHGVVIYTRPPGLLRMGRRAAVQPTALPV